MLYDFLPQCFRNREDDGYEPHMESEDEEDCLELDDEADAIVEGHWPGDDEVQCEKDTGLAILPDVSAPSDLKSAMRRQTSKERKFIHRATEEWDERMLRFYEKGHGDESTEQPWSAHSPI